MFISKTAFKEYTRCPRVYPLDDLYRHRMNRDILIFNDEDFEKTKELLSLMFDEETGDDMLERKDPQTDELQYYYKMVEKWALIIAEQEFGVKFQYFETTKEQKYFEFIDEAFHKYYSYLDGFYESKDEAIVIEVKATTSRKFQKLGFKKNKEDYPLFEKQGNILKIKNKIRKFSELYEGSYQKLFDRYHEVGKYVFDIAVERYIIENSRYQNGEKPKKYRYYLAVLNSDYVFDGTKRAIEPFYRYSIENALFCFIDLTEITETYLSAIETMRRNLVKTISEHSLSEPKVGRYCEPFSKTSCIFMKVCWEKALEKGSIMEYMAGNGFKDSSGNEITRYDLINLGKTKLSDIPISWLKNENQRIQRKCFETNSEYLNKEKIKKGLELIEYPIYHLDFESFPSPLPRFIGEKPYSQSLFQFSIHIERKPGECDIEADHRSFLAEDFGDCRKELVKELIDIIDLSQGGTVLVYNSSFECGRIRELMELFPEYKEKLSKILNHIFDLMDILKSDSKMYERIGFTKTESTTINYYHNDLGGKFSIKKVLPLFSNLTYSDLNVRNGTEAITAYASFRYLDKEDVDELRKNLITYCRQDTWAMAVILNRIRQKAI